MVAKPIISAGWPRSSATVPAHDPNTPPLDHTYDFGRRVELESDRLAMTPRDGGMEALSRLAIDQPKRAELVRLRLLGGLTLSECAEVLGVSPRTTDTWWAYARAWLAVELKDR